MNTEVELEGTKQEKRNNLGPLMRLKHVMN